MTTVINDNACIRGLGSGGTDLPFSSGTRRIVRYTEDTTLILSDLGAIIECDSDTPMTITIPAFGDVPYPVGMFADIVQIGAGSVTVVGGVGVTVESNGFVLDMPDSMGYLYRRDAVNNFVFSSSAGAGVPDGGTTSQALLKQSNADGDVTWQTLSKSTVGLPAVDNTSDADKPISSATQTALDGKLSDVTNGTAEAGATPLVGGSGTTRTVARLKPVNTDVTVTAGATITDPVSIGLAGTTLKYWEEVSTAIDATTQRLVWRPKDPNGTFVRANSLLGIAVPRAFTFEDIAEVNYATGFTEGLNLQVKPGGYSVSSVQGFAFGTNNRVTNFNTAIGTDNRVTAVNASGVNYTSTTMALGYNNNVANQGFSFVLGMTNTVTGSAYRNNTVGQNNTNSGIYSQCFGEGNNTSAGGCAFGKDNTASASGWAFGELNIVSGTGVNVGIAIGRSNNVSSTGGSSPTAVAVGRANTVSDGALAIGSLNNGIGGSRHFGDSNSGAGIRIGNSNTGATGGAAIGNSNTVAGNAYILGNSNLTTATASASLIIGNAKRDNGLRNFSSVGDQARVVFKNLGINTTVLWTDTSWRDVVNGKLLSPTNAIEQAKFTVSMDIRFTNCTTPAGAVALAVERKAIIFIEVWTRDDGTLVPIRKVIDAGDSDIFTYIDIQAIADGTGIKLQWKYASNPASAQTQSSPGTDDGVNVNLYMAGIIESLITRV